MIFGIYVHYPLCTRRCGYCDFATVQRAHFPHRAYRQTIVREATERIGAYEKWPLRTLYFGGGSPSLWPTSEIARAISELACLGDVRAESLEITLEVNPGDLNLDTLRALRSAGVNRLSIGVQSLDDDALRLLTRTHDAARARRTFDDARRAGFDNITCDLICGLPGQRLAHHLGQIEALITLDPEHISLYSLTLARRSPLYRQGLRPQDDDTMAEFLMRGREHLEASGYLHYEVSNYAKASRESLHNSLVWAGMPYLGIGASAHSTWIERDRQVHIANPPYEVYEAAPLRRDAPPRVAGAKVEISEGRLAELEILMLGLRTRAGVDRAHFALRFGDDPLVGYGDILRELESLGIIEVTSTALRPTSRGIWFADESASRLARG